MTMRPGEQEALSATKVKVAEKYEDMFSMMCELNRMDDPGR